MSSDKLAVLIDADNAQASVYGLGEQKTPLAFVTPMKRNGGDRS
ncbi:MAG TPA: hypothetical protein VK019_05880 [Pseudomonas sp.]|nr:hypothetical protein [Pseudomonas sp.]